MVLLTNPLMQLYNISSIYTIFALPFVLVKAVPMNMYSDLQSAHRMMCVENDYMDEEEGTGIGT